MKTKGIFARAAAGVLGGALVVGGAGAAIADDRVDTDLGAPVKAEVVADALTLTVAGDAVSLAEVDSGDENVRAFAGTLPAITVTDGRTADLSGTQWYVTAQSTDFTADGGLSIGAEHLGWVPALVTDNDGEVAVGDTVGTALDEGANAVGLVGQELLASAYDADAARTIGTWEADADLLLKTPADVEPGDYAATITVTLWEDDVTAP